MSYETAYNTEIQKDDITALEANEMFFDGILTDPYAFQCSKECSYPLTCKSFSKKSTEWKRAPHFSPGKNHINSKHTCNQEKLIPSSQNTFENEPSTIVNKYNDELKLNISLNTGFNQPIISDSQSNSSAENNISPKKQNKYKNKSMRSEGIQVNSIMRLIHYYFSDQYINKETFFSTLDNKKISLDYLFFDLNKNTSIPNDVRVFFGNANLKEEKNYFIVRMSNYCNLNTVHSKPSILIPKYLLQDKIRLSNKFNRLSGQQFTFFYLGKIIVANGQYLNFKTPKKDRILANLYLKD